MSADLCGPIEKILPNLPYNHFNEIVSEYLWSDVLTPDLFNLIYKKLNGKGVFTIMGGYTLLLHQLENQVNGKEREIYVAGDGYSFIGEEVQAFEDLADDDTTKIVLKKTNY
jgi:hypothetical protein